MRRVDYGMTLKLRDAGKSYAEIAKALGIPVGTVGTRLYRGRRLRKHEEMLRLGAITYDVGDVKMMIVNDHRGFTRERLGGNAGASEEAGDE